MAKKVKEPEFDVRLVRDPYSMAGQRWLIIGRTFMGVRAVGRTVYMPGTQVGVQHRVIEDRHLKNYPVLDEENSSCASLIADIKTEMLKHGASPLAVQWIHELAEFTEKELDIMAAKLKTKGEAKPVKEAAPKKKGNPEALAKAREARAANTGPDTRKISVLKKPHGAREGTKRAEILDIIYKCKTVEAAVEAGVSKSDVSWAAREEYIALG